MTPTSWNRATKHLIVVLGLVGATALTGCGGNAADPSSESSATGEPVGSLSPTATATPTVTVSKGKAHRPGNYVAVEVAGFPANANLTVSISLDGNADWCGSNVPCQNTRPLSTDATGSGSLEPYWWNALPGIVTVTVDGVEGSIDW